MLAMLLVTQWLTLCVWFYWMYLDESGTCGDESQADYTEVYVRT
jgi:hypothetical protein